MNSKGLVIPRWLLIFGLLVFGGLLALALCWLYGNLTPWEGGADEFPLSTSDLSDLGIASIQYITTLATGVFAALAFLLKEGLLNLEGRETPMLQRITAAVTVALVTGSICVGFLGMEGTIHAGYQELVQAKFDALQTIRLVQSSLLGAGVAVFGAMIIYRLLEEQ